VRRVASICAAEAGLGPARREDFLLAVNELATNSVRHGGGGGVLRVWHEDGALVAEVRDGGQIDEPLAGRELPPDGALGGHGLWLVNQLCDLMQLRTFAEGSVVRVHMRVCRRAATRSSSRDSNRPPRRRAWPSEWSHPAGAPSASRAARSRKPREPGEGP
jgi:anti-sigma regulatory factor (Ser/Thr protein kinase)